MAPWIKSAEFRRAYNIFHKTLNRFETKTSPHKEGRKNCAPRYGITDPENIPAGDSPIFLCLTWRLIYFYIGWAFIGLVPNSYSCLTAEKTHIPNEKAVFIWKSVDISWELEQNTALCESITRTIETYCIFCYERGWKLWVNKLRLQQTHEKQAYVHTQSEII